MAFVFIYGSLELESVELLELLEYVPPKKVHKDSKLKKLEISQIAISDPHPLVKMDKTRLITMRSQPQCFEVVVVVVVVVVVDFVVVVVLNVDVVAKLF